MKKQLTVILGLLCLFQISKAQYFEAGVLVGGSAYMGDLSPNGLSPNEYQLAFGLLGRYNINRFVAFKVNLYQGQISGDDANNTIVSGMRERNLSFRSSVVEFGVTNEFNITPFDIRDGKISVPYVFAGIAGFYFNPQAQFKGSWYDLQPLSTEGQVVLNTSKKRYSRVSVAIPFGFGFKWSLNNKLNIGAEFGARKTITDYLDDVSAYYPNITQYTDMDPLAATLSFRMPEYYNQAMEDPVGSLRGNPDDQDWYFFGGLTLTVNLTDKYGLEWDEKYKIFDDNYDPRLKKRVFKQNKPTSKEKAAQKKSKKSSSKKKKK